MSGHVPSLRNIACYRILGLLGYFLSHPAVRMEELCYKAIVDIRDSLYNIFDSNARLHLASDYFPSHLNHGVRGKSFVGGF